MSALAQNVLFLALGVIAGAAYFLSLRWSVKLFAAGRSLALAVALQVLRFGAIGACLALIAVRFGPGPLLFATLGILLARFLVVRRSASA